MSGKYDIFLIFYFPLEPKACEYRLKFSDLIIYFSECLSLTDETEEHA
jgi:hypothetical protein